jgi:ABC-type phosphate transport system substrate-binding protein
MRRPVRSPGGGVRGLAVGVGLLLAAGLLTSCSSDETGETDLVAQAQEVQFRSELAQQQEIARRAALLPARPAGTVVIDGDTDQSSLTRDLNSAYLRNGTATTVAIDDNGEDQAFQRLCAGEVDLVDSSREISRAEWDACRAVGLDVVQFQIAADAVVVAIKSESDVGGDCLSTQEVQDVYRAGSPVTNWAQVGLDEIPLAVAGPTADNSAFDFFGRVVLDAPQPSLINYRSDYEAHDSDEGARTFVVGRARDEKLAGLNGDRQRQREELKSQLTAQWQIVGDALDEVRAAQAEVTKGIRDQRPAAQLARDQQRLTDANTVWEAARATRVGLQSSWKAAKQAAADTAGATKRYEATQGHVAYFRFSYYELFEDQLRPFEITLPDGERNCVFPSQRTIVSGQYPLSQRLLLTTTTRSLDRDDLTSLLDFYLSHAVEAADEARLVPIPDASIAQQLAVVRGESPAVLMTPAGEPTVEESEPDVDDQPAQ